jgi:hypothetical protein
MADNSVIFHGIAITPEHNPPFPSPSFHGVAITPEYAGQPFPTPALYGVAITTPYFTSTGSAAVAPSKKVYLTNKGNIMINPNDTILIEL